VLAKRQEGSDQVNVRVGRKEKISNVKEKGGSGIGEKGGEVGKGRGGGRWGGGGWLGGRVITGSKENCLKKAPTTGITGEKKGKKHFRLEELKPSGVAGLAAVRREKSGGRKRFNSWWGRRENEVFIRN